MFNEIIFYIRKKTDVELTIEILRPRKPTPFVPTRIVTNNKLRVTFGVCEVYYTSSTGSVMVLVLLFVVVIKMVHHHRSTYRLLSLLGLFRI